MQYVKATPLAKSIEVRDDGTIVEMVVWELPKPVPPCVHHFKYRLFYGLPGQDKYRLFYGLPGQERVRYDNERGKGDHRHVAGSETGYNFVSLDQLLDDFERDVQEWRSP
jgi:hypothetical protein